MKEKILQICAMVVFLCPLISYASDEMFVCVTGNYYTSVISCESNVVCYWQDSDGDSGMLDPGEFALLFEDRPADTVCWHAGIM